MKYISQSLLALAMGCLAALPASAQDRIHYTGTELANPAYHDGQLSPVVGVHNIQIMRANREFPDSSNGNGWTYNHQPMLAYWNGQFYYQYLCDPVDEHVPPSHTVLMTSKAIIGPIRKSNFLRYKVPTIHQSLCQTWQKNLIAIMHKCRVLCSKSVSYTM
jgi:hypothetical protein